MALVVFHQEDEDVLIVYRNLKIFCETALNGIAGVFFTMKHFKIITLMVLWFFVLSNGTLKKRI